MMSTDTDQKKPKSKRLVAYYVVVIAAIIVLSLELAFTHLFGMHLNGEETGQKVSTVASQLKVNPDWKLVNEEVHPIAFSCTDYQCPSVLRTWNIGHTPLDEQAMRTLIRDSGYTDPTNQQCADGGGTGFGAKPILHDCVSSTKESDGAVHITLREFQAADGTTKGLAVGDYALTLLVVK